MYFRGPAGAEPRAGARHAGLRDAAAPHRLERDPGARLGADVINTKDNSLQPSISPSGVPNKRFIFFGFFSELSVKEVISDRRQPWPSRLRSEVCP